MAKRHPFLDAHEITENLWQGSVPPRGTVLRSAGFGMVVLCAREWQFEDIKDPFPGVRLIRAPNDDSMHFPLTREKLRMAVGASKEVVQALRAGQQVLVTCAAGLNRSGLVSALALHRLYGWAGDACIDQVRKQRQIPKGSRIKPLSNPEFTQALRNLPANEQRKPVETGWVKSPGGFLLPG